MSAPESPSSPSGVGTARLLVEQAYFLRMNGERPPGAPVNPTAETWADWDARAEEYLRESM